DEAAEAASQQDLTDAQRDETVALIELKTVIGADPASQPVLTQSDAYSPSAAFLQVLAAEAPSTGRTPSPAQPSPAGAAPLDTAAPALLRLAVSRRPEIMAANERVRSAGDTVAEARGSYLPQVDLFAMGDVIDTQASRSFAGTTYGLAASVPLYNGGDRRAQIDSALAMERQAQAERTRIELKVAQEVQDALAELRAAEQNVSTADAAEAAASEAYRVEMQRYQAGRSILVELLDALAARTAADSSKVQALYRYNLSRDQLLRATGSL
ncbi:MAG TPA: TolC family protein, partial [Chthonomonadales bacterium]|nr:TolC family protein [Chthonomonadales bacterium]